MYISALLIWSRDFTEHGIYKMSNNSVKTCGGYLKSEPFQGGVPIS